MKSKLALIALLFSATHAAAEKSSFDLSISGKAIEFRRAIEISDLADGKTEHAITFADKAGNSYALDVKYKALPSNRSFPGNLDITLKDGKGTKLGYLFLAINGVKFLKQMGTFGLVVDVAGEPVDVRITAPGGEAAPAGKLDLAQLEGERLILDILVPKFDFQMIRPMVMPTVKPGLREQNYNLDQHPYEVGYTLVDLGKGRVEVQANLARKVDGKAHLLNRVYFHADRIETVREAMYAGKYFDGTDGTFKLVYYPALGQTTPAVK